MVGIDARSCDQTDPAIPYWYHDRSSDHGRMYTHRSCPCRCPTCTLSQGYGQAGQADLKAHLQAMRGQGTTISGYVRSLIERALHDRGGR